MNSLGLVLIGLVAVRMGADADELFGVFGVNHPAYIDSATGQGHSVSSTALNLTCLARDGQGRLFSVSQGKLVQVDPFSLTVTPVLTLQGLGAAQGLAFSPTGDLYAAGPSVNNAQLYRIDTHTGSVTAVGEFRIAAVTDLAFSPSGVLYGWSTQNGLFTVDGASGSGMAVDPFYAGPRDIAALTFGSDGTLYGARNALYRIDTTTGATALIGSGGYSDIRGLAVIPEPPPIHLIAIGLFGFLTAIRPHKPGTRAGNSQIYEGSFGEIPNMPGHCMVADHHSRQIYSGHDTDNFVELTAAEV